MCEYCEIDVDCRKYLLGDEGENGIYIDGNGLLTDDENLCETKINYCPMCGRKL